MEQRYRYIVCRDRSHAYHLHRPNYPIGSTWTVTKDNYNVKTHVDDMGMDLSVWQSTTMGDWGYDQAYDYSSSTFRYPGYYTIKNNKFGYYSIEKVSN